VVGGDAPIADVEAIVLGEVAETVPVKVLECDATSCR
jgi:hypothetical protein